MSSSVNNTVTTLPGSVPDSTQRPSQRSSQDQTSNQNWKGRSGRSNGRTGRNQQDRFFSTRSNQITQSLIPKSTVIDTVVQAESQDGNSNSLVATTSAQRGLAQFSSASVDINKNRKYRQKKRTNQLLDGMSSMASLDFAEADQRSLATGSSGVTRGEAGLASSKSSIINGRKMNLTHLINNKVDAQHRHRQHRTNHNNLSSSPQSYISDRRNHYSSHHYKEHGFGHKFSKQQFLQANCQFVVLDGHDYSIHLVDPDWPVDWDCIEEIRFKQCASTETTCPICLEFPTAAKITKCGHIYCWTCMLHYLSLSDDKCRQCPICFEFIYKSDLRSVVSFTYETYSVGGEIKMELMARKRGCVAVEPYMTDVPTTSSEGINAFDDMCQHGSRLNLMIIDSETALSKIVQRERNELLAKLQSEKEEPEICFVEQALVMVEARIKALKDKNLHNCLRNKTRQHKPQYDDSESKNYLFYQCSDGQHIYLNPFSTKILCQEYGSLETCPRHITAQILQMDWISMSDSWRKRFRYLEHLPLTCEFRLIEIDFESSQLVSKKTLNLFKTEINNRRLQRDRARREERKREKIIEVEQNRKIYGIGPSLKINLNNPDQFPSVSDERFIGVSMSTMQRFNEDFSNSEEEEEEEVENVDREINQSGTAASNPIEQSANNRILETDPSEKVENVALSFKDIQLQEAAIEASKAKTNQHNNGNLSAWGAGKSSKGTRSDSTSQPSSSFAQLLASPSLNKKQWTVNRPKEVAFPRLDSNQPQLGHSQPSRDDNDSGEELRAPINDFTIGDFIDVNVVTGFSRKRAKQKGSNKK